MVNRTENGSRAQDEQVLPRKPGSLRENPVRARPTPSFPPQPTRSAQEMQPSSERAAPLPAAPRGTGRS